MTSLLTVAGSAREADLVLGVLEAEPAVPVAGLLVGCDTDEAQRAAQRLPLARVLTCPEAGGPDVHERVGALVCDRIGTAGTVLLDSSQASRDVAGWLAARAAARVCWAVDSLDFSEPGPTVLVRRLVDGGEARLLHEFGASELIVLLTKSATPYSERAKRGHPPAAVEVVTLPGHERPVLEEFADPAAIATAPSGIGSARVVIAVGRGAGGPEQLPLFRELARALGGALGATRAVVDRDWLGFEHQIGQTGAVVAPDLYIGFGVSGAVQHVVGMRQSRTIVAVNTDPHAPLCEMADLVVDADAVEVARMLLEQVRQSTEVSDECA